MNQSDIKEIIQIDDTQLASIIEKTFLFFENNSDYSIQYKKRKNDVFFLINKINGLSIVFHLDKYFVKIQIDEFMYDNMSDGIDNIILLLNMIMQEKYLIIDYYQANVYKYAEITWDGVAKLNQFSPGFLNSLQLKSTNSKNRYAQ